jgi:hypothetical protein
VSAEASHGQLAQAVDVDELDGRAQDPHLIQWPSHDDG